MRSLYVVFVVSTAALLWAAYAIARTIRRHRRGELAQSMPLTLKSKPFDEEQSPPDEH